jgi:hypothetical protein
MWIAETIDALRNQPMNRRRFLTATAIAVGGVVSSGRMIPANAFEASKPQSNHRYKIGVCDWMILKRQKLGRFN